MKLITVLALLTLTLNCFAEGKPVRKSPVFDKLGIKPEVTKTTTAAGKKTDAKKEEDCDDKAKKPIEIKAETISLSGNTGCSLDEIK